MNNKRSWYRQLWFLLTSSILVGVVLCVSIVWATLLITNDKSIEEDIVVDDSIYNTLPTDVNYVKNPESNKDLKIQIDFELSDKYRWAEGQAGVGVYLSDVTSMFTREDSEEHIYKTNVTFYAKDLHVDKTSIHNYGSVNEINNLIIDEEFLVLEYAWYFDTKTESTINVFNQIVGKGTIYKKSKSIYNDGTNESTMFYIEIDDSFLRQNIEFNILNTLYFDYEVIEGIDTNWVELYYDDIYISNIRRGDYDKFSYVYLYGELESKYYEIDKLIDDQLIDKVVIESVIDFDKI